MSDQISTYIVPRFLFYISLAGYVVMKLWIDSP
jgi:hypothetical protein